MTAKRIGAILAGTCAAFRGGSQRAAAVTAAVGAASRPAGRRSSMRKSWAIQAVVAQSGKISELTAKALLLLT
jgi:hypothetical protein